MVIGINALMFSAQFYDDDGTPKDTSDKNAVKEDEATSKEANKVQETTNQENDKSADEPKKVKKTFEDIEKETFHCRKIHAM